MATPTKEKIDFWEKIATAPEDVLSDLEVEVERVFPAEDAKTGYPIAGYCCTIPAGGLTKEAVREKVGGGTYRLQAKTISTRQYFAQTTLVLPGLPKIVLPGQVERQERAEPDNATPARGYEEGYKAAIREAERKSEAAELRAALAALDRRISEIGRQPAGSGPQDTFLSIIEAVGRLRDVLGLSAGQGGGLDPMTLINLLREENQRGENRAKELFDTLAGAGGVDPDAIAEGKLADALLEIVKGHQKASLFDKAAKQTQGQEGTNQAAALFVQARDGVGDLIERYFGPEGKIAAQAIRGARSVPEYLHAIEGTLKEVLGVIEELQGVASDEPGPAPGDNGVGGGGQDT